MKEVKHQKGKQNQIKGTTIHKQTLTAYVAYFRCVHIVYLERDGTKTKMNVKLGDTLWQKEDNKSAACASG